MGAAKDHFLKDKKSADLLNSCTHAEWFNHVLILVSSDMSDGGATSDEMRGARKFREILLHFADPEEPLAPFPTAGLDHNLDSPRKDPQPPKKK